MKNEGPGKHEQTIKDVAPYITKHDKKQVMMWWPRNGYNDVDALDLVS